MASSVPPPNIPPPCYSEVAMEAGMQQDPGEYMYPGDTKHLVPQEPRQHGISQGPVVGTQNWPPGGGYVPNPPQQHGIPQGPVVGTQNWPPGGGYVPNPPEVRTTQVIVVRQNNSDAYRNYIRWRMRICLIVFLVKIVIIGIILGVIYSTN